MAASWLVHSPGSISDLGKNRDKCLPDGPLVLYEDLAFKSATIWYAPRRRVQYCGSELSFPRTFSVKSEAKTQTCTIRSRSGVL